MDHAVVVYIHPGSGLVATQLVRNLCLVVTLDALHPKCFLNPPSLGEAVGQAAGCQCQHGRPLQGSTTQGTSRGGNRFGTQGMWSHEI